MSKHLLIKILFLFGLLYSLVFHFNLHSSPSSESSNIVKNFRSSDLVAAPTVAYSSFVTKQAAGFDYSRIEKLVWSFTVQDSQLVVNQLSTQQLEMACSYIVEDITQDQVERLKFLIRQSMHGSAGTQLSDLLLNYCEYTKNQKLELSSINSTVGDEQLNSLREFLSETLKTQEIIFGAEVAKKIFTRKNLNLSYLIQSRIINLRTDMSQDDKQRELSILQKNYKNKLSLL